MLNTLFPLFLLRIELDQMSKLSLTRCSPGVNSVKAMLDWMLV